MTPRTRFTFFHASLAGGQLVVNEPVGWKASVLSLELDEKLSSRVEYFKGNFMWYGTAMSTLKGIEGIGLDEEIRVLIEITFITNGTWETLFDGLVKIAQLEELFKINQPYKLLAPIISNNFWAKIVNRFDTPVNLEGNEDLDGNARTAINKVLVRMPSQKIRVNGEYQQSIPALIGSLYDYTFSDPSAQFDMDNDHYAQIDFDTSVLDEAKTKHNLLSAPTGTVFPVNIFTALYDGVYNFESKLTFMRSFNLSIPSAVAPNDPTDLLRDTDASGTRLLRAYFQKNNEAPIEFAIADTAVFIFTKISGFTEYTANENFTLIAGDKVTLFVQSGGNWFYQNNGAFRSFEQLYMIGRNTTELQLSGGGFGGWTDGGDKVDLESFTANYEPESYLKIQADTTYVETTTDAFLVKDALESILSKYAGADNVIISSKFTNETFNRNAVTRGKNARGWSFADKQFSMSAKDWWEGCDPVWNLGMGYKVVDGVHKIELEDKAHFFNPTTIVNFSNVANLTRRYDLERFFKAIELGYIKWSAESSSGIDDPQTKRIWATALKTYGRDYKYLSKLFAGSLGIEQVRRDRVELKNDNKLDEDILLMALMPDGDNWVTEFMENYDSVTGLLNEEFRINLRHTAARLFKRWANVMNPSIPDGNEFKFAQGEGNYDMTSQFNPADYEATANPDAVVSEKENFVASSNRLWVNKIYEVKKHPIFWYDYKQIRDNKNNAIGISISNADWSPMHIINLDYEIFAGKFSALLLKANDVGSL